MREEASPTPFSEPIVLQMPDPWRLSVRSAIAARTVAALPEIDAAFIEESLPAELRRDLVINRERVALIAARPARLISASGNNQSASPSNPTSSSTTGVRATMLTGSGDARAVLSFLIQICGHVPAAQREQRGGGGAGEQRRSEAGAGEPRELQLTRWRRREPQHRQDQEHRQYAGLNQREADL
jgi:hypothetical protein